MTYMLGSATKTQPKVTAVVGMTTASRRKVIRSELAFDGGLMTYGLSVQAQTTLGRSAQAI